MWTEIFFITLLSFANSSDDWEAWRRDTSSIGTLATNHRDWGHIQETYQAPRGYYACGARYRLEVYQGDSDDTAMNGIDIRFCQLGDWDTQVNGTFNGIWGYWSDWQMCDKNSYIFAVKARV